MSHDVNIPKLLNKFQNVKKSETSIFLNEIGILIQKILVIAPSHFLTEYFSGIFTQYGQNNFLRKTFILVRMWY